MSEFTLFYYSETKSQIYSTFLSDTMFTKIKSPLWIFVIGCAFYITVGLISSKKYEIPPLVAIFIFDLIIILSTMVPKATEAQGKKYGEWFEITRNWNGIAKLTVMSVSSNIVFKCSKIGSEP